MTLVPVVAGLILSLLPAPPLLEARQATTSAGEWQTTAASLAPQTLIEVTLADGTRLRGRFIDMAGDTLRIGPQARARRPRPARAIPLTEIKALEVVRPGDAAFVQQPRQIDLFVGYLNANEFMHGWNTHVSLPITKRWKVIFEIDGAYGPDCSGCVPDYRDLTRLTGVRFAWHPTPRISPFLQVAGGTLHSKGQGYYYDTVVGQRYQEPYKVNYSVLQPGGGATVMLTPRLGIGAQYDWQLAFASVEDFSMSVFPRIAVGTVIRLGRTGS